MRYETKSEKKREDMKAVKSKLQTAEATTRTKKGITPVIPFVKSKCFQFVSYFAKRTQVTRHNVMPRAVKFPRNNGKCLIDVFTVKSSQLFVRRDRFALFLDD